MALRRRLRISNVEKAQTLAAAGAIRRGSALIGQRRFIHRRGHRRSSQAEEKRPAFAEWPSLTAQREPQSRIASSPAHTNATALTPLGLTVMAG